MAELKDLWEQARAASEADPDALDRVRTRWEASVDAGADDVHGLLRGVGAVETGAAARVAARVRQTRWRRRAAVGTALAMAATAALWLRPAPEGVLDQPLVTGQIALTQLVSASSNGAGHASGTTLAPRISWTRGRLDLDVVHGAGVDLQVETPEAVVSVVGTVFAVTRDALGTDVEVSRGAVRVACTGGATTLLGAGESAACWPVTLGGLLGRARTLESRGADVDDVLATLDRALSVDGPRPLRGEVLAHRVRILYQQGRDDEAVTAARSYLSEGHAPRRSELTELVDHLTGTGAK
jgi:ferric-dicitrate binding protein FerR (iron transport regulator)